MLKFQMMRKASEKIKEKEQALKTGSSLESEK